MNREIKFRCWIPERVFSESIKQDAYMAAQGDPDLETLSSFIHHYGDEPTLMQFTGLKDKNGKEIYEGDWCTAQFRGMQGIQVIQGQIIMDEFMWCIDCTGCVGDDIFSINRPHDFEIIGNIYENPELINQ